MSPFRRIGLLLAVGGFVVCIGAAACRAAEPGDDVVADVAEAIEDRGPDWVETLALNLGSERYVYRSDLPSLTVLDWRAMGGRRRTPLALGEICKRILADQAPATLKEGLVAALKRTTGQPNRPNAVSHGESLRVERVFELILPHYAAALHRSAARGEQADMYLLLGAHPNSHHLPLMKKTGVVLLADVPPGIEVERLERSTYFTVGPSALAPLAERMIERTVERDDAWED